MIGYDRQEPQGILAKALEALVRSLDQKGLDMHSLLVVKDHQVILEKYYEGYGPDTLHRMFSISKSFTAMAIGLLEEEGRLRLDDPIVRHFPEYVPENPHPYLQHMTIRHMLQMETCHKNTTYKGDTRSNWVASFFLTPPDHEPGSDFKYDTSSSHTLCALVEKLTGMPLLTYMRSRFLEDIGFSKEAYMMADPFGVSMGGSGLVAKPMDILIFADLLMNDGLYGDRQLLPAAFVREATSYRTDTSKAGKVTEERQGYGYQIWRIRHNGFACYGMGGQLAICLPDHNLLVVTTADTLPIKGGHQLIFDSVYETLL